MSDLEKLLELRFEQTNLLKAWSTQGKVKVQRTFQRDGKNITQTFWG